MAIPCGKALMGPLDVAINRAHTINNLEYICGLLANWSALIHQTSAHPTHVKELVEHTPSYRGLVDVSKWGVGGVWFSKSTNIKPLV